MKRVEKRKSEESIEGKQKEKEKEKERREMKERRNLSLYYFIVRKIVEERKHRKGHLSLKRINIMFGPTKIVFPEFFAAKYKNVY